MLCDILCWVVLYGIVGYIRRDQFFVSPFEFVLVDCLVLAVILQALYIVGGYSRNTEMRGLIYTTEHILAIASATAISAMLIYSAATFDHTMKPSRGMLLLSFMLFLPVSLLYRRWIRNYVVASSASRAFLVIGSGTAAACFYDAYKNSPNGQQLDFVALRDERVGQPIAGEGSPVVQGNLAAKLNHLSERYSGIILAEKANSLSTRAPGAPRPSAVLPDAGVHAGIFLRNPLALCPERTLSTRFGRSRLAFSSPALRHIII